MKNYMIEYILIQRFLIKFDLGFNALILNLYKFLGLNLIQFIKMKI